MGGMFCTERIGGTSTCWTPLRAWIWALILAAAAAAAAAGSLFSTMAGLPELRGIGLRLRRASESLLEGDRERRSNRERRGSTSV